MKTVKEIKSEIEECAEAGIKCQKEKDAKGLRKSKARIKYLKPILAYLQTEPTRKFCQSELERMGKLYESISGRWKAPENCTMSEQGKLKKLFDKEWGISKMKEQIKNLKFILKA